MVHTDVVLWGYQPHFRALANNRAKRVFDGLDSTLDAKVFLVGVGADPKGAPVIFLEAEKPELLARDLEGLEHTLEETTEERKSANANLLIGGPPEVAARFELRVPLAVASTAVSLHLERSTLGTQNQFWTGLAQRIDGCLIVPVLALARAAVERHPRLSKTSGPFGTIPVSLLDALARELMSRCSHALRLPNAGEDVSADLDFGDDEDLIRRAASHLMYVPVAAGGEIRGLGQLFSTCEALSAEAYERAEIDASLLIGSKGHPAIQVMMQLADHVDLRSARAARKLLQMSKTGLSILSDGTTIWGMGRMVGSYDQSREDLFEVRFANQLQWELRHGDQVLFEVRNRTPRLSAAPIEKDGFVTFFRRRFPGTASEHAETVWRMVAAALVVGHGTTLVVTQDAQSEARRLAAQATLILPTPIDTDLIRAATAIDGALLLDISGVCHAIGVILDGVADGKGEPSRGSRFNSALRYVGGRKGVIAVVVSDDTTIDFLPDLRPRMSRAHVRAALEDLRAVAAGKHGPGRLAGSMNALYAIEFYLSAEECAEVNRLRREVEHKNPPRDYEVRLVHRDFAPDPEMDASYLEDGSPADAAGTGAA